MYVRERLRVYATWLVGFLIGLAGFLIIILSTAKVNYLMYGWQYPRKSHKAHYDKIFQVIG
jgi:hypothetical protein